MIVCIDCGLTNGKVLLFAEDGRCLAQVAFPTPLDGVIIDTCALEHALTEAVRSLLQQNLEPPAEITCVCVSGHGNGLYALGDHGPWPVGYSSMVTESTPYVPASAITAPITYQSAWAGQPLAILAWLKAEYPAKYRSIRQILFCKDLLRWFMTGTAATELTDASAAGLINIRTAQYDRTLLSLYGLEDAWDKLPPLTRSDAVAGHVTPAFAAKTGLPANTPVLAGLFDVNSCMLGAGVIDQDHYSMTAGTWGINAAASSNPVNSDQITQCCLFYGALPYVLIDSAPTSCVNLEWFLQQLMPGVSYEAANQIVAAQRPDELLLYLPYLYPPMDRPDLAAEFVGLRSHHTKGAMLRAVYEEIVLEHRRRLSKLQQLGYERPQIVLSGGAAKSPVFAQMFADICGKEVLIPAQSQAGAMGGVLLSQMSAHRYNNLRQASEALIRYAAVYRPDSSMQSYYTQSFRRFCSIVDRRS